MASKTIDLLGRLFSVLSYKRKKSLFILFPIAIITGLADVMVVGLVTRLFTAVVGKENRPVIPFSDLISTDPFTKIIWLIVLYILFNWIASFMRLFLRAFQERVRTDIFLDLSRLAQKNIFCQKYEFFLTDQSKDITSKILLSMTRVSEKVIRSILQIISGLFIVTFIFLAILGFAKITAFYLILCLMIGYSLISILVTPRIRAAARQRIILEAEIKKVITDSIKTITDVHLSGSEKYFQDRYEQAGKKAYSYLWKSETLPEFPRSLIEPFGITLIFCIGLFPVISSKTPNTLINIVPFLATIAVSSLKLTPPLQDFFRGITDLRSGIPDLEEALKIIELKNNRNYSTKLSKKDFHPPIKNISLKSAYYKYPFSNSYAIKNLNLTIPLGAKIAFVGKSGSGKTTTANLILCLLEANKGEILIDGEKLKKDQVISWQSFCSYVPQTINLLNDDVMTNIAYGLKENDINEKKVWASIKAAQLEELVYSLPKGIKTNLGENGIRLSGGQRQRIALARAFYRDAKVLVLDEATSSLDNKTEAELINAINILRKKMTIIFIAHRLSTVRDCDCIYEFEMGEIKSYGKYDELIEKSVSFREMIYSKNKTKFFN